VKTDSGAASDSEGPTTAARFGVRQQSSGARYATLHIFEEILNSQLPPVEMQ
jgi:hypothetical protein